MARLLLTNDDGIHGPGLHALVAAMVDAGHDVVVAAPDHDASGTGASLGQLSFDQPLALRAATIPGAEDTEAWAIAGPPGLCVVAAMLGGFGTPPEAVVSGINLGLNTGRAVLHSGTVGAALTAQNFGCSALAVSSAGAADGPWSSAGALACQVLDQLLVSPPRTVLNLNVPAPTTTAMLEPRWARLAPFGSVRAALRPGEGFLELELHEVNDALPPDTDTALLAAGHPTITAIVGVAEAWRHAPDLDPSRTGADPAEIPHPGAAWSPDHRVPDADDSVHLFARARGPRI